MRNQGKYKWLALITLTALLLTACGGQNRAASMHLVRTEGTVQVDNEEGKKVKIAENLGLYSGYEVTTKGASYGWITLDDSKLAKMDEDTDVEIRKKSKQLELYVRSGGLFFNVTEPLAEDEAMTIRTSTMAVGIRGTCGWVEVEDNSLMCVYLLRGTVECTIFDRDGNALSSETITAGQAAKMVLDGDDASIIVAEFRTEKAPDFVREELEGNGGITGSAEEESSQERDESEGAGILDEPEGSGSSDGFGQPADDNASLALWQQYYLTLLEVIRTDNDSNHPNDRYYLYDIDEDGTPELITCYSDSSSSEMNSGIGVYTFHNGVEALTDGTIDLEFSTLYSYPGQNGVLFSSNMWRGYFNLVLGRIEDGRLIFEELDGSFCLDDLNGAEHNLYNYAPGTSGISSHSLDYTDAILDYVPPETSQTSAFGM